ncbi:MAG: hypothetical protein Q7T55_08415 [Solirubrobacteraceae bacterium]|nr:hypothetical protein [Solirubrobacteraceae bacterium]
MSLLLAAAPEPVGGAPLWQLGVITAITSILALITLQSVLAYRAGRAPRLRATQNRVEELVGLPGWAALPGAGAIVCALVIILGATWDIGLHIDVGRDDGPLGTVAHYPLLFGLFASFLMGILAIGLAPKNPRRSSPVAFHWKGFGPVPAASALLLAGSTFGMAAFPLDDVWHRIFGVDVTLWGPTHVMIIGGTLTVGIGGALLLIEGARAAGRDPFRAKGLLRRPLPALLAAVGLYLWAASTHEFNWGVPQYRLVWHPLLLAFGAAQALVLARVLAGRGGALLALAIWLPLQAFMSLAIGGPLQVSMPSTPLFIVEALVVEAIAFRRDPARPVVFGALAGLGIGTLGFGSEYLWSQIAMPLPWTPGMLPEAIPVAIAAGISGGVIGALMAQALNGSLHRVWRPGLVLAAAGLTFFALGWNAASTSNPEGVTATMAISNVRQGPTPGHSEPHRVGDLTVRFSDPAITKNPSWIYAMGWQGDGSYIDHLKQRADGSWATTQPVPLDGKWKTMVRVHSGKTMLSTPIRFPADPAISFAGFAEQPTATRAMVPDTQIMQLERLPDAPDWAWTPAATLVLSLNLLMALLMAAVCVRIGRMAGRPGTVPAPRGTLLLLAERAFRLLGLGGGRVAGSGA